MDSEEKKELVGIIGQLNSVIYDLKQNKENENSSNKKNMISFVNLGKNSPMMSSSAVDFLETERSAMNEAYETEIQSLKHELMIEKESSKNAIETLQQRINLINSQKDGAQRELEEANIKILQLKKLFEEQQLSNSHQQNINQPEFTSNDYSSLEFGKIMKENDQLKEKINELEKQIQIRDNELQTQIQANQKDRDSFYAEVKRLTENSISNMNPLSVNSNQNEEIEKRINSETSQLRSNLAYVSLSLQKAIDENNRLTSNLHSIERECSNKIQSAFEECAQYRTTFASLQSLFNTDNNADIISEVTRLYQKSKNSDDNEHLQMLLKDEIKKNEELRLMIHMGARIPSQNQKILPPMSPQLDNKQSNDGFLLQERIAQLEAEKEELSRVLSNTNLNADALRNQINEKNHIIEENEKTIRKLQTETDTLRGEILGQEEQISQFNQNQNTNNNTNNQANDTEMKELLALIENLREENDELKLTIKRKESEANAMQANTNSNLDQNSNLIIQSLQNQITQIQQKVLHVASVLKQQVEIPTPAFASFTEFLEDKVVNPTSVENGEMNAFASEISELADQMNFDFKTLSLVQNQCVSAYDQMNTFFAYLKKIADGVENFYCRFDSIWESVCGALNMDQNIMYDVGDNNDINNFDMNMNGNFNLQNNDHNFNANYEADGDVAVNTLQNKRSPKTPNGNSSFLSLLDSPKIYRNTLLDQNENNNEINDMNNDFNDQDDFADIPSLTVKNKTQKSSTMNQNQRSISSSSSSKIPKANGAKSSKSRIPLSNRPNVLDTRILSPKQAPSHIPELPTKKKNRFA